jgi:hypothetical protein
VAGATPCPKNGEAGPPHFWPRGGRPPHTGRMGVAEATPGLWGWSGHPERPKKKKKPKKMGLGFWGWPDHPLGPGGGFGHHHTAHMGVASATPRPLGVVRPPPKSQTHFFRFFFFLAFRGGRTTPKGLGWLRPPPYGRYGVAGHPLAKNEVVRPPHFLGKGWLQPPRFLPFFSLLFLLKKKKNPKICKTTPFCPKQRSFGVEGIMGIYIFIYPLYP